MLTLIGSGLFSKIRLGWKGFPGKNTIALNGHSNITAVKFFITLHFYSVLCSIGTVVEQSAPNFEIEGSKSLLI